MLSFFVRFQTFFSFFPVILSKDIDRIPECARVYKRTELSFKKVVRPCTNPRLLNCRWLKITGEPEAKINPQGSGNIFMDYINIGSNGFAQVGDDEYYEKSIVEMKFLLNYLKTKFPVPEKFSSFVFFYPKNIYA